jgi:DNA-binding transcriptional MerR regulator
MSVVNESDPKEAVSQLLTTSEVAELTRAPVSAVRYWRHAGVGPASFRLGRRVVYRLCDVERWLEEKRAEQSRTPAGQ